MADDWNWVFHLENNYPQNGWDYWYYCISPQAWKVQDHSVSPGQSYYGSPINPNEKRKVTFRAHTVSSRSAKTLTLFIGCWNYGRGCVKSQTVTISIKESDAILPNWHYYCNEQYMADSFYDERSFEVFMIMKEDGELEVVYKENTPK